MTAKELIQELQQVHPDTEVTVTTKNGKEYIDRVVRSGYADKVCTILTED